MKKLAILLALLLLPSFALGQTGAYSGHSFVGGVPATTSGMNSSNYLNGIIPGASITVYLTGTTTKATIYADGSNTPLSNPFFSNLAPGTNPGGFTFWSLQNQGLDIQAQGGMGNASCTTSPLCYSTATMLQVDVYPNNSFFPLPSLNCTGTGSSQVCTFSGGVSAPVMNGWQRNVCTYSTVTYPTLGDQMRQCNTDALAAGGGLCDVRCAEGTTTDTLGAMPIEIGSTQGHFGRVIFHFPDIAMIGVTQSGVNLPTPSAPTVTAGSGYLPAATYYTKITYTSGGGHSISSAETTTVLGSIGDLIITSPPALTVNTSNQIVVGTPQRISYTYDVYVGTSSGTEKWQNNCLIGQSCLIGATSINTLGLYTTYASAPSTANGTPAIIIHGAAGSGIISDSLSGGTWINPTSSMNVSNIIDTEDIGSPLLHGVFVGNYTPTGTVTDSVIRISGAFSQASIGELSGFCAGTAPFLTIYTSNDVTFGAINGGGDVTETCNPVMRLVNRYQNSDSNSLDNLTFPALLLGQPAGGGSFLEIDGDKAGGIFQGGSAANLVFLNPSFENFVSGGSANVTAVVAKDVQGLTMLNSTFFSPNNTEIAISLSETLPCNTQGINITHARDIPGPIFVNDTITPEAIGTPPGNIGDLIWGTSPSDNCSTQDTTITRGQAQSGDATSAVSYSLNAYSPAALLGANLVPNPVFAGTGGALVAGATGVVANSWNGANQASGTTVFAVSGTPIDPQNLSQTQEMGNTTTVGYGTLSSGNFTVVSGQLYKFWAWVKTDSSNLPNFKLQISTYNSSVYYCADKYYSLTQIPQRVEVLCTASASGSSSEMIFSVPTGHIGNLYVGAVGMETVTDISNPGLGSLSQVAGGTGVAAALALAVNSAGGVQTNQMSILGDMQYGGASGVVTRLPGPTVAASTTYILSDTTTGLSAAQAPSWTNSPALSAANMTNFPISANSPRVFYTNAAQSSANTGSTTENNIYTVTIPAGTMGANSRLEVHATVLGVSGNTGTCSLWVRLSGASGTSGAGGDVTTRTGSGAAVIQATIMNNGASAQTMDELFLNGGSAGNSAGTYAQTINTAVNPAYLNFDLQNSVSGDSCYIYHSNVVLWPQG